MYNITWKVREYEMKLETLQKDMIAAMKAHDKERKMAISSLVSAVKKAGVTIKGCSHITGGGFYENVPRMLPDGISAMISKDSYPVPPIFKMLQKDGNIEEHVMYNTFNMGIGMVLALDPADVDKAMAAIEAAGEKAYVIGQTQAGAKEAVVC